jgi:hypothetical protein
VRTRFILGSLFVLASSLAARSSRAQDALPFSERAQNVIVLDNLGGFVHTSSKAQDQRASGANVAGQFATTPLARIGYHRFLTGGLSLGAGLIYSYEKVDLSSIGGAGNTTFGIAPRVGYAIPASASTAFWLRAGFTYVHGSADNSDSTTWQLMPAAEAFLVLTPVSHFGVTLGPFIEYGVVGKQSSCGNNFVVGPGGGTTSTCTDRDLNVLYVGLSIGLLADF